MASSSTSIIEGVATPAGRIHRSCFGPTRFAPSVVPARYVINAS